MLNICNYNIGLTSEKIMRREARPPYCPEINSPTDCYNFEEFDFVDPPIPPYEGKYDYKSF